jgi:hypothetical protein
MSDQRIGIVIFLLAFCSLVYFLRELWRLFVSPEFKHGLARLRERRRRRKAARRSA